MAKKIPIHHRPISIPKATMDLLLGTDKPADCIALYTFYYYTAVWQQTNRPKATVSYCVKGLKLCEERVRRIRKSLKELGLIQDIEVKNEKGQVSGFYVEVNYYESDKASSYSKPETKDTKTRLAISHGRVNGQGNAYKNNNKMLSVEKVSTGRGTLLNGTPKVDKYVKLARRLHKIILTRYKSVVKVNHSHWANEIRLLHTKDEYEIEDITSTMQWLKANIKDKYTPQIMSASSFRSKFLRLLEAESRQRENEEEANELKPTALDERIVKDLLSVHSGPKVKEDYLLKCVALSNKHYIPFRKKWKEFIQTLRKSSTNRICGEHILADLFERDLMIVWFAQAGTDVNQWANWSGNLDAWIWKLDSPRVERWADDYLERTCGHRMWADMLNAYKEWVDGR